MPLSRFLLLMLLSTPLAWAERAPLNLAAASDLIYCLPTLNAAFTRATPGATVQVSTGSSGNFFAQIQNGAPFDVFLSADIAYPRALIDAKQAQAASLTPYARGRLVLWSADATFPLTRGMASLDDARLTRLAIANPAHAPYGRAAQAALMRTHQWDALQSKLVLGDNISQAAQFAASGNAQVAIIALSLARAGALGEGHYWLIPQTLYPPLIQAAVITQQGAHSPNARRYIAFLRSPAARRLLQGCGFNPP